MGYGLWAEGSGLKAQGKTNMTMLTRVMIKSTVKIKPPMM